MRYTEFKTILKEASTSSDYTVVLGDTLGSLAKTHGVKLADLIAANKQIKNPDRIYPGDIIKIPGGRNTTIKPKDSPAPKKEKPPVKKPPSGKHEIRNVAAANDAFDFFKGKFFFILIPHRPAFSAPVCLVHLIASVTGTSLKLNN